MNNIQLAIKKGWRPELATGATLEDWLRDERPISEKDLKSIEDYLIANTE